MATGPTAFGPTEPLSANGDIWQFRDWFKNVVRWFKRLCGVEVSQTASFTANENMFYPVDCTSGAITVTLPAAATWTPGKPYTIKKTDTSANAVTITRTGTDTLDGATSVTIVTAKGVLSFISDGISTWHILQGATVTQGTWTPTVFGTGGSPTLSYTLQGGSWTRTGNCVHVVGVIQVNVVTVVGAGNWYITGLPFVPRSVEADRGGGTPHFVTGWAAGTAPTHIMVRLTDPSLQMFRKSSGDTRDNVAAMLVTDVIAGVRVNFSATYYTDSAVY